MSVLLAGRTQAQLEQLANRTARGLAAAWAAAVASSDAEAAWMAAARPLIETSARRSLVIAATYAKATRPGVKLGKVSPLIVPDAIAHTWDPLAATWRRMADGADWAEASALSADDVIAVGEDAVMGAARDATADHLSPVVERWRRRLNAGACKWCMSMAKYTWTSAHEATFGHSRCRCVAVPSDDLGDHNDTVQTAAGWGEATERQYRARHQIARLKESEQNALKRSREAADKLRSERDPARRERLSMREQDWETRAERAAEKRRVLETGSHRLAA